MVPSGVVSFVSAVHLHTRHPRELAAFYGDLFGADFREQQYGELRPCLEAQLGELTLSLHPLGEDDPSPPGTGRPFLEVNVFDLPGIVARLERRGTPCRERRVAPGVRSVSAEDPDGNEVRLVAHPDWWYLRIERLRRAQRLQLRRWRRSRVAGSPLARAAHWLGQGLRLRGDLLLRWLRRNLVEPWRYHTDRVAIASRDLAGFTHLVSSREGLFAVGREAHRKVLHGLFFGLTARSDGVYVFEANGPQGATARRGRILRLRLAGERLEGVEVVAKGLDDGIHQIEFIGDRLVAIETYRQRVVVLGPDFAVEAVHEPAGPAAMRDWANGYVHLNSVAFHGGAIYLLAHCDTIYTGQASRLLRCNQRFVVEATTRLAGGMCHNLVFLADGRCLICDSMGGRILDQDGNVVLEVAEARFLRGLSVDEHMLVVGESDVADRRTRQVFSTGRVYFFTRAGEPLSRLELPAAPLDLCRIDGRDRSVGRQVGQPSNLAC